MKRKSIIVLFLSILSSGSFAQTKLPYKDPKLSINKRVKDLLGRMSPEEKFFQLFMVPGDLENITPGQYQYGIFGLQVSASSNGGGETQQMLPYNTGEDGMALAKKINSIQKYFVEKTRLGIPIIAFDESLHGLVREGATAFPQSIGLAATFDTALVRQVSRIISREAKSRGIRQILSPVINIASDVRWGRVEETYGEDPYLTSAMAVAYVRSFERNGIITTPKHLIANVGDGGRDSYPIHLNERYLEEIHFPPFKACIEEAGMRSVMTSYNSLDGTACTSNDWMLNQKLKKEWGFQGFVISDAGATGGSIVLHNTTPDYPTAGKEAVEAGLDVIFQTDYQHYKLFMPGFTERSIDKQKFDSAVARVLRVKFELGLFENPYVSEKDIKGLAEKDPLAKEIARKAALESIVLLKNEAKILPLQKNIGSIAVIGEEALEARLGGYSGPGNNKISILEGIKKRATGTKVLYAAGCGRTHQEWKVIDAEFLSSNGKAGLKGEYFTNINLTGEPAKVKQVENIDFGWTLSSPDPMLSTDFYSIRWTGKIKSPKSGVYKIGLDGNDGFRLFINNQLLIDNWQKQTYSTRLTDFTFEKGKEYDIRVEFFEPVGNAHIKLIWDVTVDMNTTSKLEEAVATAKQADVVVMVAGIHEGEFQDRAYLSLPGRQEELIQKLVATGKPVIVVLVGGSAITMNSWIDQVKGIVDVWYPGEEGGTAVAQVLFGDYNPAGRLPVTFPIHESQLPLVYNHKPTGRGDDYHNLSGLPLFPFGFGLSYTSFEYSDVKLDKNDFKKGEATWLRCTIKNTGDRPGEEVVQLYIKDVLASVARPVMELKGFQRIQLAPSESKEVAFKITPSMLTMLNDKMQTVVEPGDFLLMLGASSRDIRLKKNLHILD